MHSSWHWSWCKIWWSQHDSISKPENTPQSLARATRWPKKTKESWPSWTVLLSHLISARLNVRGHLKTEKAEHSVTSQKALWNTVRSCWDIMSQQDLLVEGRTKYWDILRVKDIFQRFNFSLKWLNWYYHRWWGKKIYYNGDTFGPHCICRTITVDMLYVCVAWLSLQTLILYVRISVLYSDKNDVMLHHVMFSLVRRLPSSLSNSLLEVIRL